jgi:hypothetical protein
MRLLEGATRFRSVVGLEGVFVDIVKKIQAGFSVV